MHLPAVLIRRICIGLFALILAAPASASAEPKTFKLCWSIFAGWMPWGYAADEGIVKKWADKYGIRVEVSEVPDYVGSIERYSAGEFDACSMTNMDALTIPAAAGVDSTARHRPDLEGPQGQNRATGRELGVALSTQPRPGMGPTQA